MVTVSWEKKITIIKTRRPETADINEELQWFCDSLGIFSNRDRDKSCFRMFIVLLKALRGGRELSSDEIAERVSLSRGTVVHHLRKLIDSGLVIPRNNRYALRVDNLEELIGELERDLLKTMEHLKKTAKEIDERLEL